MDGRGPRRGIKMEGSGIMQCRDTMQVKELRKVAEQENVMVVSEEW